jgi:ABC-type antimicrobial peptide transport system permease subunit
VVGGAGGGGKSVVLQLIVDGHLIAIGMFFALTMGLLGGLAPALSAMRVRPLESLR